MTPERLRLVIIQEAPGLWLVRGLEHDLSAQGPTIAHALRAALQFVEAHTAFDNRHALPPLSAFAPAPQKYWNAYATGTPVPLTQLGITAPGDWDVRAAFATGSPAGGRDPAAGKIECRHG
jgi:hypothetical protein